EFRDSAKLHTEFRFRIRWNRNFQDFPGIESRYSNLRTTTQTADVCKLGVKLDALAEQLPPIADPEKAEAKEDQASDEKYAKGHLARSRHVMYLPRQS